MSKIGVTWRMIRSSSSFLTRAIDLVLGDARLGRDVLEGLGRDREAALHQVEQALVEVVERDRGAVLAAAELRTVLA